MYLPSGDDELESTNTLLTARPTTQTISLSKNRVLCFSVIIINLLVLSPPARGRVIVICPRWPLHSHWHAIVLSMACTMAAAFPPAKKVIIYVRCTDCIISSFLDYRSISVVSSFELGISIVYSCLLRAVLTQRANEKKLHVIGILKFKKISTGWDGLIALNAPH